MSILDRIKKSNCFTIDLWVMLFVYASMAKYAVQRTFGESVVVVNSITPESGIVVNSTIIQLSHVIVISVASIMSALCLMWFINRCGMLRHYRYLVFRDTCAIKHKRGYIWYMLFGLIPTGYVFITFNIAPLLLIGVLIFVLCVRFEYEEPRSEA